MKDYNHKDIEKKWQDKWEEDGIHKVADSTEGKKNFFTLVEFTYPSGNLHVGHWYAFAVPDIFARYKKMKGFNVLYPMGFDAFGLPAENAAIKLGADPKVWTYEQMNKMREQLKSMGAMFPWEREVVSCDPQYYKWTQWMFNQFLKNDLVYRDVTKVNWCPKDQTILANEQVVDGCCERCGSEVEQRNQEQWMIRITKYADRLIDDLDALEWPHAIKEAQKNWIGRSEGSEISFKITCEGSTSAEVVKVFTTRADTLFGVTYIVLAPEHPFLTESVLTFTSGVTNKSDIEKYISDSKKKSELERQQSKEKTGVEIKGIKAINSANGEEVSIWIADYVLAGYGTGAVMAVPAHDERDFDFAKKFNLPKKGVIDPQGIAFDPNYNYEGIIKMYGGSIETIKEAYEQKRQDIINGKTLYVNQFNKDVLVNSEEFSGMDLVEAKKKITEKVGGKMVKTYRLRDWGISRQRYWGTPIPIVYDTEGKAHPVPDEHLPWLLPNDVDHTPDGTAPLARSKELLERTEKIFGKGWKPEVETMDTFVDSSWYFYRYLDNKNEKEFASKETMDSWMPIDLYMGGPEHTTMHLLYSRFWTKALYDLGFVKDTEAYTVRRNRGLILGPDGEKMSKSKGNVVNPDEIVDKLGADTVRLYLAFMGPYGITANYPWDPNGVVGVRRFLERVWKLKYKIDEEKKICKTDGLVHKTIKGVAEDIEEFKMNTAISKMMILTNALEDEDKIVAGSYHTLIRLLAPFAPHIAEELWREMGETESIHISKWPEYDPSKIVDTEATIAIQVNGKLRGSMIVPIDLDKDALIDQAKELENVSNWLKDKTIKNIIIIPNKIINFVIE